MKDEELIKKWRRGRDYMAYKELKRRHVGMVMLFVNRYSAAAVPRAALESEAWGLFDDAVNSYKLDSPAKFSTHLNYQLRKLDRYTKKYQNVARIPENLSSRIGEYDRTRSNLALELGRQPKPGEIAKKMNWTVPNVKRLEKSRRQDLFEGGFEAGIDVSKRPDDVNIVLLEIREELSQSEKDVFDHLIGYKKRRIKNKKELAMKLGVSTGRLSQITSGIARKVAPFLSKMHGVGIQIDVG